MQVGEFRSVSDLRFLLLIVDPASFWNTLLEVHKNKWRSIWKFNTNKQNGPWKRSFFVQNSYLRYLCLCQCAGGISISSTLLKTRPSKIYGSNGTHIHTSVDSSLPLKFWHKMAIFWLTLPETNIVAENRTSQKESSLPTNHFQGRTC